MLSFVLVLFSNCKNDDDSASSPEPPTNYFVKKITDGGSFEINFTYTNQNKIDFIYLASPFENITIDFIYNAEGLVEEFSLFDDTLRFQYTDGILTEVNFYDDLGNLESTLTATYADGTYTFDNGTIMKFTPENVMTGWDNIAFSYNENPGPFRNLDMQIAYYFVDELIYYFHWFAKYEIEQIEDPSTTEGFEYEKDEDGKIIAVDNYAISGAVLALSLQFEYEFREIN